MLRSSMHASSPKLARGFYKVLRTSAVGRDEVLGRAVEPAKRSTERKLGQQRFRGRNRQSWRRVDTGHGDQNERCEKTTGRSHQTRKEEVRRVSVPYGRNLSTLMSTVKTIGDRS
jgi:hypothetical protein